LDVGTEGHLIGFDECIVVDRAIEIPEIGWKAWFQSGSDLLGDPPGNRDMLLGGGIFDFPERFLVYIKGYLRHVWPPIS
jgi:hypothetical protein